MTPKEFIERWKDNPLKERASYQLHFIDLCALVGQPHPSPASHETYCFERGAMKTGAGNGWADVWKQGFFGFEYKAARSNLGEALKQLMTYALALENPPLLVVCDTNIIQIHTHFTNAPSEVHTIALEDIGTQANLEKLRWLFTDPNKFHPQRTITQITQEVAAKFAEVAQSLNSRGHDPQKIAHFLNQCLFCLFAEDANLLPGKLFERLLDKSQTDPGILSSRLEQLFAAMRKGGDFALENIHWFNGGLFETIEVLPLEVSEIKMLYAAAKLDWSDIEPSIFGTLFERGLDPSKRSQLGAHYTDPTSIMRLVNPVIVEPLTVEWEAIKKQINELQPKFGFVGKKKDTHNEAMKEGYKLFNGYLERLKNFKVLDPACGSGNFLYLALRSLKDLEHKANLDAEQIGLHRAVTLEVSPANVLGIELNTYAAELARVTVWIGEIQWMLKNGYSIRRNPILQPLDHIENRDAVLNADNSEPAWPTVNAIIGNPPFIGDKKMRTELGDKYTDLLRTLYDGRVPGGADFVTYWFEKARAQIESKQCERAGLVSTNSIRGGASQRVLARICETTHIFNAWSDEEWINEGAAVRVSLTCFGNGEGVMLDGQPVDAIHADLTAGEGLNLTQAKPLKDNEGLAYQGTIKTGPMEVEGALARQWLKQPNPNGRPNSDVARPWANGMDVTRRPSDTWIIDFGVDMAEEKAALYELPYQYAVQHIKPFRVGNREESTSMEWWLHHRPRPEMRAALVLLPRYILTPRVSKYRLFIFAHSAVLPDSATVAIARSDDASFGVLHSRFHEIWALRMGTSLEDRPRYTPTTTFETFPFPEGLTPNLAPAKYTNSAAKDIAIAAQKLNELRNNWLNPPEWMSWEQTPEEATAGYPARPVAKAGHEDELKKRTLTNLYNARPAWLDNAHQALDAAVAKTYGWNDYTPAMTDDEILRRLLVLNHARAA